MRRPKAGGRSAMIVFAENALDLFLRLAGALLNAAQQFLLLPPVELQVVVRQVGVFLFEFAFDDVPVTLQFEFIHSSVYFVFGFCGEFELARRAKAHHSSHNQAGNAAEEQPNGFIGRRTGKKS